MRILATINQSRNVLTSRHFLSLVGSRLNSTIASISRLPIEYAKTTDDPEYDSVVIIANDLEKDLANCKLENNFPELKNHKKVNSLFQFGCLENLIPSFHLL